MAGGHRHSSVRDRHGPSGDSLTRGEGRQRSAGVHGGGRALRGGDDRPPRPGRPDGRVRALAWRECRDARLVRAHRGRPKRRDRVRAALVARAQRGRATGRPARPGHAGYGSPAAHARHADPRPDGPAGRRARPGIRPPVPHVHDSAPPGRDHDGRPAARRAGRRAGRPDLPVRRRRERRPNHRNRPHDPDARRPQTECSVKSQSMFALALLSVVACATTKVNMSTTAASPDPRVGLRAGWMDAAQAAWNVRLVSTTPPSPGFINRANPGDFQFINSDLSFTGSYVIQGNFSGVQVWDITNPKAPRLQKAFVCPGSQSDVSVYRKLLFVSGEALNGRTDCGTQGVSDTVSHDRLRGIRIFDITDIANPRRITDVQTCRGSHTHTVVTSPTDTANVYIYVSGSAPVRSPNELAGCSSAPPDSNPNSALFRIEVIQVPLAHPEQARIVSSPRIFNDLTEAKTHAEAADDLARAKHSAASARAAGGYTATVHGQDIVLGPNFVRTRLDSIVKARGGTGAPTATDSATLRTNVQAMVDRIVEGPPRPAGTARPGPTQCHDITVYPAIGLAGGACGGYGLLLDI